MAVDKPAGVPVHRTRGSSAKPLLQSVRDRIGAYVQPVHRLDQGTSGVVLFAKSSESTAALSRLFAEHQVQKTYGALVRGWLQGEGVVDHSLKHLEGGEDQTAVTSWRGLADGELSLPVGPFSTARFSWVELSPKTGRTHQLRRHMVHLRHPIIGDVTYGDGRQNRFAREHLQLQRLALCARRLAFVSPFDGQQVEIVAPPAPELVHACAVLGIDVTDSQTPEAK